MNAALLPALVAVAPPPSVAPPVPASGTAPATPGAFAQELSQAQTAAPAEEAAPEAQAAPATDEASPAKPAAAGDEAPVSKSLRQWLLQTAAARRAALKGAHDSTSVPAQSTRDRQPADPLDPASRPRRGQREADPEANSLIVSGQMPAPPTVPEDGESALGNRAGDGVAAEASVQPQPLESSATPLATPAPRVTAATAVPTPSPAGPILQAVAPTLMTPVPGTTAEPAEVAATGESDPPPVAAETAEGRAVARAVLPERTSSGSRAESAIEPVRGAPPGAKALRDAVAEPPAPVEERESFAMALSRQQEGTAIVMPQVPQAAGSPPRTEAGAPTPRPPVDVPIPADFNGPQWAQSVGNQLSLLATDGVQNARLHLHPAEMGPISVQIVVDGQTAQVHLAVDNAETRQALEQAMPNLAASLRESGLTLTGGGVFEQPRQRADQTPPDGHPGTARTGERGRAKDLAEPALAGVGPSRTVRRQGVVDLYA